MSLKCLWEQAIRGDLTDITLKKNRSMEDLVREIALMSQIGTHPSVVGFVGANISSNSADPIIFLEYLDGGLNPQPSTLNPQPSTLNPQPSTLNPHPSTLNPQPSNLNPQP